MVQSLKEWPDEKGEEAFKDVIIGFINFYETDLNKELLYFTEKFKETIEKLTKFLSLRKTDDLSDMIAILLKFAAKHKDFVEKTLDQKKVKERSKKL